MNERRYSCNQIIRQAEIVRLRLHATSVRQGGLRRVKGYCRLPYSPCIGRR